MQPHAAKDDFHHAFAGLVFPASTDIVIRTAQDHGGIDHEVVDMLMRLPETSFESMDELVAAVRELYASAGVPEGSIPL